MPANKGVLVGATQPEVEAAAAEIGKMSSHCRITKAVSGFMADEDYRKVFTEAADADFIFLGLSTPKTQRIADIAVAARPDAITWGIGAGTIKIFAGTMNEAPEFWRRTGLQWLYRLFEDPKNLWRRYLLGNPLFVARVLKARWGGGISR
jgi:exopolysaccharide biosynthesis WecB/TagA/CpsF family protein